MPQDPLGALKQAGRWADTPLVTVPEWPAGTAPRIPGALPGTDQVMEALPGLLSGMTTPAAVGTTLATLGSGAAFSLGRPAIAKALAIPGLLADIVYAARGSGRFARGVAARDPGEMATGAAQTGLSALGAGLGVRTLGRPPGTLGHVTPSRDLFSDETLASAVEATNDPKIGGSSTRARGGDLGGRPRTVAVGVLPETAVTIPPERLVTVQDLRDFVEQAENNKLLQRPRMHVGTWKVGPGSAREGLPAGTTVIDVGGHPPTRPHAMALARKYDQAATFDAGTYTELPNPDFKYRNLTTQPQQTTFPTSFQRRTAEVLPIEERVTLAGREGAERAAKVPARRALQRDQRTDLEPLRAELLAQLRASVGRR